MKRINWVLLLSIVFCVVFWGIVFKCFASEQRFVQIRFTEKTECGEYSDCLYFPEGAVPEQKEIDRVKKERVDNWIAIIKNPVVQPEPTEDQLIQQQSDIDTQITSLQSQKSDLMTKVSIIESAKVKNEAVILNN